MKSIFSKICKYICLSFMPLYSILQKKWIRRTLYTLSAILIIVAGSIIYANCAIYACRSQVYHQIDTIPEREYGLLLGTIRSAYNGRWINSYYAHRIEAATELYKAGKIKKIIVSGDNSRKTYDETTDMYNDLIHNGVDSADILCDYAGFRTFDSIIRAKNVFQCTKFTIISQEFHCQRAIYIANSQGFDVIGYAAKDVNRRQKMKRLTREPLACFLAFLDVNILNTQPYFPY